MTCNDNVSTTLKSRRQIHNVLSTMIYDIAPKLPQRSEEPQMRTIHVHMVTFPLRCFKVVNKINNNMTRASYAGSIL